MKYRPEVDGLRALAVIPVILFHAGLSLLSGGFVGVDIFFVISGYLITSIILSEMQQGTFSIINFYERRARRILPLLFVVIFFSFIGAWLWLLPEDMKDFSQSLVAVVSFSSNILFMQESGYWGAVNELKPLLHTWSLAVEEQFYIIFPLFLLLAWKIRKRWIAVSLVIIVFVLSLTFAHIGAYKMPIPTFFLLITRAWELIIGAGIAYYFFTTRDANRALLSNNTANEIMSLIGLGMIIYAIFCFDKSTPFPSLYALVPTVGAGLIILFSTGKTGVGRLLSTRVFVGIGLVSYGAYLWHQPLLAFTRYNEIFANQDGGATLIFIALLSLPLAYITWRWVEKPFRKKGLFNRKIIFIASIIGSVIFGGLGVLGHIKNGFPERFTPDVLSIYYTNNGSLERCDEGTFRRSGSTCIIGDVNVAPSAALLGDSHSSMLTKSLDEILKNKHASMVVYAQSWCPPLLDFATDNVNKVPVCREFMTNAFGDITKNTAIESVILAAEWPNYTKGIRPGTDIDQAYYTDEISSEKSLKENHTAFTRSVDRTLKILSKKKVIFITSVPEYEVDVPVALAKLQRKGETELPVQYRISLSDYNERNKEVMSSLADNNAGERAKIIDASTLFCKQQYCDYYDGKSSLYDDSNHLTYEATRRITKALMLGN